MAQIGNYNVGIPSSALLASDAASSAVFQPAAGIVAGTARSLADVTAARKETEDRRQAKIAHDTWVTEEELSRSCVRQTAVEAEVAAGMYGPVGAPQWATALIQRMDARFDAMNGRLDTIDGRLDAMNARQLNDRARKYNKEYCTGSRGHTTQFRQLVKENPGQGQPLPGQRERRNIPVANVGTPFPANLAPNNMADLDRKTLADLSQLAQ